jgi:predicted outer membrane repeat protein
MKKRTVLTVLFALAAFGAAYAQTTIQRSLYVSAKGDDNNNGRSETTPYKTLEKAVEAANAGVIKTITVIGTITGGDVYQSGDDEILVTGKPDASGTERAVISRSISVGGKVRFTHIRLTQIGGHKTTTLGAGVVVTNPNGRGVDGYGTYIMTDDATITGCKDVGVNTYYATVTMSGNASITNNGGYGIIADTLTMSGNASITNNGGYGIGGDTVTMSGNAKVSGNKDGGVICSTLTMSENAEISGNVNANAETTYHTERNNGGGARVRSLTMSGNAKIINNVTRQGNGGGVCVENNSTISGNALISGNTAKNGGGIYFTNDRSTHTLTIEGGEISNNKAENGAGVYVVGGNTFNHKGGTVTNNNAEYVGGGVYVQSRGTYTAGGGTVSGNTAGDGGDDLFKQ